MGYIYILKGTLTKHNPEPFPPYQAKASDPVLAH